MTSDTRSTHDKPAAFLATGLGVLAILGTVFFLPRFYCENPSATCTSSGPGGGPIQFDVTWARQEAAAKDQAFTSNGKLDVSFAGLLAGASVTVGACTDSATAPLQNQAVITYTIKSGSDTTAPKSFTCGTKANGNSEMLLPPPKIATTSGTNASSARANLWRNPDLRNGTALYTIEVSISRPAGTVPVPAVGGPTSPTVSVTLKLAALKYEPNLTPHKNEVSK